MPKRKPQTAAETFPEGTEFSRVITTIPTSHFWMLDAIAKERGVTRAAVAAAAIVEYVRREYLVPALRAPGEAAITAHEIEFNLGMRPDPPPDPIVIEVEVKYPPGFPHPDNDDSE